MGRKYVEAAACIVAIALASSCYAQAVPQGCFGQLDGKVFCPPFGGDLQVTLSGEAVCGKGRCVRDLFGKVTCSSQQGGSISRDAMGQVACTGGCEEASQANCQRLN